MSERELAQAVALAIKSAITPLLTTIAVLEGRLAVLESRPLPTNGKDGEPGKNAEPIDLVALTQSIAALIPVPKDGKDAEPIDLDVIAQRAAALIPTPKDGRDGKDAKPLDVADVAQRAAALIPTPNDGLNGSNGRDGKDAEPVDLIALAKSAAALIPVPKDGRDGAPGADAPVPDLDLLAEKTMRLVQARIDAGIAAIPIPKDGIGLAGALITKSGELAVTLSDGTVRVLGPVVGGKGDPGQDGAPGLNGKDGADGFGFDDFEALFDQACGCLLRFRKGDLVKDFQLPVCFDAGVWEFGRTYPKGAGVTVKGAWWIAQEATATRPGDGTPESSKAWRLAVKAGRDGKPGRDGRDVA